MGSRCHDNCSTIQSGKGVSKGGHHSDYLTKLMLVNRLERNKPYKMVSKFQSRKVCIRVLEIDDHELLVLVCWEQQGRLAFRHHAQDVTVLSL